MDTISDKLNELRAHHEKWVNENCYFGITSDRIKDLVLKEEWERSLYYIKNAFLIGYKAKHKCSPVIRWEDLDGASKVSDEYYFVDAANAYIGDVIVGRVMKERCYRNDSGFTFILQIVPDGNEHHDTFENAKNALELRILKCFTDG